MNIDAANMDYSKLNALLATVRGDVSIEITNCLGQRFIGAGRREGFIHISGTPGNALGAYLAGASISVYGNAQDAVGDTMDSGEIIIHGSAGDALGYSMRGGRIFTGGDVGYRAGIHMKEYGSKSPVIVIGGKAGSFLGEYQAGGTIIVLGLGAKKNEEICGNFCGTGMHGGIIFLRCQKLPPALPEQVKAAQADAQALERIAPALWDYSEIYGIDVGELMASRWFTLTPNTANPYKQLYVAN